MAMDVGPKKGISPSMNVTPLVDVVLVLLIIFMVVTPLLAKQMSVRVPAKEEKDATPPPPGADVPVVIMAKDDGTIELNQARIAAADLPAEILRLTSGKNEAIVFFSAEENVSYGAAVAVMDRAKSTGVTVAVLTAKPE